MTVLALLAFIGWSLALLGFVALWGMIANTETESVSWASERVVTAQHEHAEWLINGNNFDVMVIEHHHRTGSHYVVGVLEAPEVDSQWLAFPTLKSALLAAEEIRVTLNRHGLLDYPVGDGEPS